MPEPLGDRLGGRGRELAAAPGRRVGPRDERGDLVAAGEPLEDVGAEGRGRRDRDPRGSPSAEDGLRPQLGRAPPAGIRRRCGR